MNELSTSSFVLYGLAVALIVLSAIIFAKYQRSQSIRFYVGFLFGLAALATAQASLSLTSENQTLLLITRFGYLAGVLTFSMLTMFSLFFPVPSPTKIRQPNLIWIIPLVFFTPLVLLSDSFVQSVKRLDGGIAEMPGSLFFIFPTFVAIYVIWTIRNLIMKRAMTQGSSRPVGMFLWALVVATMLGLIFDVLLPALGNTRVPIGLYSAIAIFGFSTLIVLKK